MSPLNRCIIRIRNAYAETDPISAQHVNDALEEFDASSTSMKDRILGLETIFQIFREKQRRVFVPDSVVAAIDRYQDRVIVASN